MWRTRRPKAGTHFTKWAERQSFLVGSSEREIGVNNSTGRKTAVNLHRFLGKSARQIFPLTTSKVLHFYFIYILQFTFYPSYYFQIFDASCSFSELRQPCQERYCLKWCMCPDKMKTIRVANWILMGQQLKVGRLAGISNYWFNSCSYLSARSNLNELCIWNIH